MICAWPGAPTQTCTGTGTLACSISNCMTLKNGPLREATGRSIWDKPYPQGKSACELPTWAPDTEPGLKRTAVSAHLCGFELAGSAVGKGGTLSQETETLPRTLNQAHTYSSRPHRHRQRLMTVALHAIVIPTQDLCGGSQSSFCPGSQCLLTLACPRRPFPRAMRESVLNPIFDQDTPQP